MFPYYGAKWRLSAAYSPPAFDAIVEPFAGSACYALRHYRKRVHLYDINPVIVGVWDYLINSSEREILALPKDVPETVGDLPVCQEAKWLIGFWINPASAAPRNAPTSWARYGRPQSSGPTNSWFNPGMRRRVARQSRLIKHWTVTEGSYGCAPNIDATWFVDPPYQRAGKHYVFSDVDYTRLGHWCESRRGHVIVCENEGADWLPFQRFKATAGAVPGKQSNEVIWERGQSQMRLAL